MAQRLLFARVGWMRWYKGPRPDDEKPIGGGKYNQTNVGHEAFNFLPIGGRALAYFQPRLRRGYRSSIRLQRVQPGFKGDLLDRVMVVFVASNPISSGQFVVGWYKDAEVHRFSQGSSVKERNKFSYFVETSSANAVLVPVRRRIFSVPNGKGGMGQANICYVYEDEHGTRKQAHWINEAIEYISSYQHEDAAQDPTSESDQEISELIGSTIEHGAGYQSNPRIRRAVEDYAMRWANKRLREMGFAAVDKHKTNPYDFLCTVHGADLYVEVKGTQEDGRCVSLTPNEVKHAKAHGNSALFVVYGVQVRGKRTPEVSGGKELFLNPWDISFGRLEPHGYAFTLPESAFTAER
ncbi:MAG: DUF3883 domain-containing protein [Terracidiphilus sp.]|jgi:hypothetical protein